MSGAEGSRSILSASVGGDADCLEKKEDRSAGSRWSRTARGRKPRLAPPKRRPCQRGFTSSSRPRGFMMLHHSPTIRPNAAWPPPWERSLTGLRDSDLTVCVRGLSMGLGHGQLAWMANSCRVIGNVYGRTNPSRRQSPPDSDYFPAPAKNVSVVAFTWINGADRIEI